MPLNESSTAKNAVKRRRLQTYIKAERKDLIERACKEANVQFKTIVKLAATPLAKWERSNIVKHGTIDNVIDYLPNLRNAEEFWSYMDALKIRRFSVDSQSYLEKLSGRYRIITNISNEHIYLDYISIVITKFPFFPIFEIFADAPDEYGGYGFKCDGYIVGDGRRASLTGLSEHLDAFVFLNFMANGSNPIIRGVGIFDLKFSGICLTSEVILVPEKGSSEEMAQMISKAKERLRIAAIEMK